MNKPTSTSFQRSMIQRNMIQKNISRGIVSLAVAAGLSLAAGTAFAEDPTSMAPPLQTSAPAGLGAGTNAAADSVFNWQEIPANQQVPLTRAAFDQGGYQLYDTAGETIVIPFTNNNLYVMKFATSQNGTLYFENQGGYPVLYVPKGGFLENATVSGARWYPFGEDFHPAEPVFLGIAPSYPEFIDLGWYPETRFYGGYYGSRPFLEGGIFLPTVGLFFSIGGHPYYGWNSYHNYFFAHPGFYHTGYFNRGFYHYAGNESYHNFAAGRRFGGGGGYAFNHSGGFDHGYAGHAGSFNHGYAGRSEGSSFGSGRTFRGGAGFNSGNHSYTTDRSYTTNRSVIVNNYDRTNGGQTSGGGHTFRGGSNSGGQAFSAGRSYGGGQNYSGGHSFSGGSGHSFSGGSGHSFTGSQSAHSVSSNSGSRGGNQSSGSRSGGSQGGGSRGGSFGGGRSR